MKNILYILIVSGILAACDKKLDISPSDAIPGDVAFSTDENVKKALNGAYDAMTTDYLLNGDLQLYSELLGADGEITWTGTYGQPRQIFEKQILVNNDYVASTWDNAYATINICNNILDAIDVVKPEDQDRVKGEALFIRGEMYFELVRFFGKPYSAGDVNTNLGVQIVTTPTKGSITEANYVPRSTVAETYDLVLNDLTEAESLLPEENGFYATKYAAAAILSRVYLQMEDFAKARDEANTVIESGEYSLTSAYADAFNNDENSSEDIFAVQVSEQDGSNDFNLFWSIPEYGGRSGDVDVEQKHLDLYEPGDARLALFYEDPHHVWRSGKWQQYAKNIPIVRLGEMYVTRAECNYRLGTAVGATPFEDIETIRARAGLSTTQSYITLNNITMERHLEIAHEGERIHDVKRLRQSVDGYDYDANELVFPIPINQIIIVGKDILKQNDGY
jgi:tetratricopeptide (TPR) repeat protein